MHVDTLYVRTTKQSAHAHRKLLDLCIEKARAQQYHRVELSVSRHNTEDRALLASLGAASPDGGTWEKMCVRGPSATHLPQSATRARSHELRVRRCDCAADAADIHELVMDLAEFEKMPHAVRISADDLARDGFHAREPLYFAALAELRVGDEWIAAGLLLCYGKYSTRYVLSKQARACDILNSFLWG